MMREELRKLVRCMGFIGGVYATLFIGAVVAFVAIYVPLMVIGLGQVASVLIAFAGQLIAIPLTMALIVCVSDRPKSSIKFRIPEWSALFDIEAGRPKRAPRHEHPSHA